MDRAPSSSSRPSLPVLVALFAAVLLGGGCDSGSSLSSGESDDSESATPSCNISSSRLTSGCRGGRDCIPSIDGVTAGDDRIVNGEAVEELSNEERVVGLLFGDQALAIPLSLLGGHEVVNFDDWAERTFTVTYCPLTGSGLAFRRRAVDGAEFGVSGLLYQENLVLYDRRDPSSLWVQMNRQANCGPAMGTDLTMLPIIEMNWGQWHHLHPDTKLLSGLDTSSSLQQSQQGLIRSAPEVSFASNDPSDKERVLGIPAGPDGGLALPFSALNEVPVRVVEVTVGNTQKVVFWSREARAAMAFETVASFHVEDGRILDDETESVWAVDGSAIEGPLKGTQLDPVETAYVAFWKAWLDFHPDTDVWEAP